MRFQIKLILFLLILPLFSSKCKKERAKNPGEIVYLREASLSEIKNEITGNWKIHYSYGGFTGNIKSPMPNSFFRVLPNDSVYLTFYNSLYAADKAIFTRTQTTFGYSAWIIQFKTFGGLSESWVIDYTKGDSLVLVGNYPDPDAYIMSKSQ